MRSILWKSDYQRVNQQFLKLLNEPLRDGITILFQAGISYDPLHGFSLRIVDIDTTFVIGELEKEKRETISKLLAEGVFEQNKRLPFPLIAKRLAIISVETSKGLSDFYKIITHNMWGYVFETTLFPALLQGDKSIPSIINQLAVIAERLDAYDAVAIIRGGGGEVGLSSYNNYHLAKAIATFPIPILTGIGHSTNETVSETVSYKNAITPSELADFLIQKFHNFSVPVDRLADNLERSSLGMIDSGKTLLDTYSETLARRSQQIIQRSKEELSTISLTLTKGYKYLVKQEMNELEHFKKMILIADPAHLLKRGFSITRINGKIVTSKNELSIGDHLETEFVDGNIKSKVV